MADRQYANSSLHDSRHAQGVPEIIVTQRGEFAPPAKLFEASKPVMLGDYEEAAPDYLDCDAESFVFDEDIEWGRSVARLPEEHREPIAEASGDAVNEPGSPYAKRRPAKAPQSHNAGGSRGGQGRGHAWVYWTIIAVCLSGVATLAVMMMPQMAGYFWRDFSNYAFINGELLRYDKYVVDTYKQYRDYLNRETIFPGVFVDGVSVGDMTPDEARAVLTDAGSAAAGAFSVTVAIGNKTWNIDSVNVPSSRNLGNVVERAYAIGRVNTASYQGTNITPFHERANIVAELRETGMNLTTSASYDHEAVRAIVNDITEYVTRDPIDAQIQSFDYMTRTFSFTEDQPGVTLDSDLLYSRVTEALDRWEKNLTVTVDPIIRPAAVTKDDLVDRFTMIAAYTTTTTKDSNRNNNIDLACRAISGTALLPGESFSFNGKTGQRTTDKGYKSAGAIAAGQSIEEVGGGICQVSSTIFNAVARANLEITERYPHAWPSSYVNKGEDATVNWPNLDFKFKNNTGAPIFLITYYKDRKLSAEIWGMTLGDGVGIDLESKVIKTMEPTTDVTYVLNPELEPGSSKITVKPRTGYVVETYKVWQLNGEETKRELLHTSTYKAYQQVVEYN